MALITLVGESVAKVGKEFYYLDSLTACTDCKLRNVCFNLENGSKYRIVALRGQSHDCIEREDRVHVVEVVKIPIDIAIPKKLAIEGSMITFKMPKCKNMGCKNYPKCHPNGIEYENKYSIIEVAENVDCPIEEKMVFVKIL